MTPGVDGEYLPEHPAVLLREGRYNKVDIISGINRNDGALSSTRKGMGQNSNSSGMNKFILLALLLSLHTKP